MDKHFGGSFFWFEVVLVEVWEMAKLTDKNGKTVEFIEHVVSPSDNLRKLAVKYETTTAVLAEKNRIPSSAYIFPGQVIYVPKPNFTVPVEENVVDKGQTLSELLNLSFETSKLTVSSKQQVQTNEEVEEEEAAGFVKIDTILLPDRIKGTMIVTTSALMFDPGSRDHEGSSNITPLEDISWMECVRVRKETDTSQKLEEEFPMVNSLLRSISDYFEESSDECFYFIFMKQSVNCDFQYYRLCETDVNKLFSIFTSSNLDNMFDGMIAPTIDQETSYSDFQQQVIFDYPTLQPNWFLLNSKVHKKVQSQYEKSACSNSISMHGIADNAEIRPKTTSIEASFQVPVPELENSDSGYILSDSPISNQNLKTITSWLPDTFAGIDTWKLLFSTEKHGCSLASLYRASKNERSQKMSCVMIIEDCDFNIFGAFMTELPHVVERNVTHKFFGSGECFLFKLAEDSSKSEKYEWTGANNFFCIGDMDHFAVGGGKGKHGLWIDSRLCEGSSQACDTFGNDMLSGSRDFVVSGLELWVLD